ncbi:MAG TPA: helix-turn-helix domain-containing protein [Terriglobales bacterium]|jgi:DNA-binding MarR family transcriptional regulator|nr:helix-turn-helix domain-containing protein [Terriglobales bacterium]
MSKKKKKTAPPRIKAIGLRQVRVLNWLRGNKEASYSEIAAGCQMTQPQAAEVVRALVGRNLLKKEQTDAGHNYYTVLVLPEEVPNA